MKRLVKYLRPYWKNVAGAFFFLLLVDAAQWIIPLLMRDGINNLQSEPSHDKLVVLGLSIIGCGILVLIFRFLWRILLMKAAFGIAADMRATMYARLLGYSHRFYASSDTGDLMARAINDLNAVRMMFSFGLVSFFDSFLMGIGTIIFMFWLDPQLTLIAIIPLPLLSVVVLRFEKRIHATFRRVQEKFSIISNFVQEAFSGIFVVRAFSREGDQRERFSRCNEEYIDENLKFVKIQALFDPLLMAVVSMSVALILFFGGRSVIAGEMGLGDLVAFIGYLNMLSWPVMAIGFSVSLYQRGLASLRRIEDITEYQEPIVNRLEGSIPDPTRSPIVEIRDLSFGYDESRQVLRGVNLRLQPGETLGILGRIGSGKTTLVRLLTRLVEVQQGSLLVGGHSIESLQLRELRGFFTVVPQESQLFSLPIRENIRFGRPDASDEEVAMAAYIADLSSTIEAMPDGYGTLLGERGVNLSGGQKQRLAIARALLRRSPVLVFDDAFSSIDTETEERILSRLKPILQACSSIFIGHRVSTLRYADHILVLDEGEVVEEGTHAELMERAGRYRHIAEMQNLAQRLERS